MKNWFEARIIDQRIPFALDVNLKMGREVGVLFGPSGSGKTLTLRSLAGLRQVRRGYIRLGERVVLDTENGVSEPPQRRRLAMLFQDLALFPHMTVIENVRFAYQEPNSEFALSDSRNWLERVRLETFEGFFPNQLSGGQRQRVALARSLAAGPDLLMLDEPFSSLDGPLRRNLRKELRKLQKETGIPILYVTHQVEDICALGDRVFLMEKGKVSGSIAVKDLLSGRERMRFWKMMGWGNVLEGEVRLSGDGRRLFIWPGGKLSLGSTGEAGPATAFVRPDSLRFLDPRFEVDEELAQNVLAGTVEEVLLEGGVVRMQIRTASGGNWQVERTGPGNPYLIPEPGETVIFAIPPVALELIPQKPSKEEG